MSVYFHIHFAAGRHQVCATTNGLDHQPIPSASFGTPREAIRYASMREADIQPVRSSGEDPAPSAPPRGWGPRQSLATGSTGTAGE
jgi:hypothetical protein